MLPCRFPECQCCRPVPDRGKSIPGTPVPSQRCYPAANMDYRAYHRSGGLYRGFRLSKSCTISPLMNSIRHAEKASDQKRRPVTRYRSYRRQRLACPTLWPRFHLSSYCFRSLRYGAYGKRTCNPSAAGSPDYGRVPRLNAWTCIFWATKRRAHGVLASFRPHACQTRPRIMEQT